MSHRRRGKKPVFHQCNPGVLADAGSSRSLLDQTKSVVTLVRRAGGAAWLILTFMYPAMAKDYLIPSEEHRALAQATLDEVAAGTTKRLWMLLLSTELGIIPRPTTPEEADGPASPEQINAYLAYSQNPDNAHVSDSGDSLRYPCAHLFHPGSTITVLDFGISGNDNGVLVAGAHISVKYLESGTSPVVFLDVAKKKRHRLKSVKISLMYTADVGSPNILDPTGWYFKMDRDDCQITEATDW